MTKTWPKPRYLIPFSSWKYKNEKEQLHITPISKTMEKHEACEAKQWEKPSYYAYDKDDVLTR